MSRQDLAKAIWRACDIMRRDDGTTGIMEYMEQLSWLLFLKSFEGIEDRQELKAEYYELDYTRVVGGPYRWSVWTGSRRRRVEAKVAEVRQEVNKANAELERAQERLAALQEGKDPNAKNSRNKTEKSDPEKIAAARQDVQAAQTTLEEAQASLKQAEAELADTIAWLEEQVHSLYDEEAVEQRVLNTIDQQFGGHLDLMQEQLDLLRETERKRGEAQAKQLVESLVGEQLLRFVDGQLFPHLRRLQGTPEKDIISNIFNEIPGNRMRSAANLKAVIDLLDEIDFQVQEDTQIVSQVYEDLLSRLGTEGGIAGEFYTPRPIIRFIVDVIKPQIGETVYDPFCGSAGFLVESYKQMVEQEQTPDAHEMLQRKTFYGQEKKPLPALLGMMNMILHGVLTPNITRVNTLEKDDVRNIPHEERHHVILTNPPFGGKEGPQIQGNFSIQSNATELLALQHIIAKLRPDGRCGLVVPEGILFRGDAFASVKQALLSKFNLYAIISLPVGTFANVTSSGAGPKTDILFFEGPGPTKQILYYEVNQVGFSLTKAQRPIQENDLPDALETLRAYRKTVQDGLEPKLNEWCWLVEIDEVRERDYDLSIPNPNQVEEKPGEKPPHVLIGQIVAKQERLGQLLNELQGWLSRDDVLSELEE